MANITEFLQTYMGLASFVQQAQQMQRQGLLNQEAQARDAVGDFQAVAGQTVDPEQRWALARRFAPMTGMTAADLIGLAPPPDAGVIKRWGEREGLLEEENRSPALAGRGDQLEESASQALTGMNRGGAAMSGFTGDVFSQARTQIPEGLPREAGIRAAGVQGGNLDLLTSLAASNLPQNELTQAAGVQAGTRMTAGQDASTQLGWANNRLGWAGLLAQVQLQVNDAASGRGDDTSAQSLQDEIGKALRMLQETKGQMTDVEVEVWRNWYNTLAVRAQDILGVRLPQIESIGDIQDPGIIDSKFKPPKNASDTIPRVAPRGLQLPPGVNTAQDLLTLLQNMRAQDG